MSCVWTTLECRRCGAKDPIRMNVRGELTDEELEAMRAYFLLVIHKPVCPKPLFHSPHMVRLGR